MGLFGLSKSQRREAVLNDTISELKLENQQLREKLEYSNMHREALKQEIERLKFDERDGHGKYINRNKKKQKQ